MNIRYLLVLVWAVAISATARASGHVTATREFDAAGSSVTVQTAPDGKQYSVLTLPGMITGVEAGSPALPYEIFQIVVPIEATNFRIASVNGSETATYQLLHRLMPTQPDVTTNQNPEDMDFVQPLEWAYTDSKPIATILSDGYLAGDIHVVTIGITPAKYIDPTLSLEVYGKVDIDIEYDAMSASTRPSAQPGGDKNELYRLFQSSLGITSSTSPMKAGAVTEKTASTHYYIIVPSNLESATAKLATWKKQKGYTVHVKTIESICEDAKYKIGAETFISGRTEVIVDSAASLRAYLHDEFEEKGPYYCLLIGDYRTSMPIRKARGKYGTGDNKTSFIPYNPDYAYCKNPGSDFFIPTDNYFADFDTDWNLEKPQGVNIYSDYFDKTYTPDIIIGRLLCSSVGELLDYTEKLIIYESNPGLGDNAYLGEAMFFEARQFVGKNAELRKYYDPFGDEHTLVMRDNCPSVRTPNIHQSGSDIIREMGAHGFSSPIGHGSPVSIVACDSVPCYIIADSDRWEEEVYLNPSKDDTKYGINNLTNNYKPGVIYTYSCTNIPFDAFAGRGTIVRSNNKVINILDDGHTYDVHWNWGAAYTNSKMIGGVAYIGNTRYGLSAAGAKCESFFFKELKACDILGIAFALSKTTIEDGHTRATCNLVGDPELRMWLGKPTTLAMNVSGYGPNLNYTAALSDSKAILDNFTIQNKIIGESGSFLKPEGDYVFSVWTPQYLPFIRYYGTAGTSTSVHDAITTDAILGGENGNEFIISNGGVLNLSCTEHISGNGGVTRVKDGGIANFSSMKNCALSEMSVESGGKLNVTARGEIKLEACTINEGAEAYFGN